MTVIDVTKENFQVEIMESDKPVLIDFFAPGVVLAACFANH